MCDKSPNNTEGCVGCGNSDTGEFCASFHSTIMTDQQQKHNKNKEAIEKKLNDKLKDADITELTDLCKKLWFGFIELHSVVNTTTSNVDDIKNLCSKTLSRLHIAERNAITAKMIAEDIKDKQNISVWKKILNFFNN